MADIFTSFGAIAVTIFLAELVDKDAFLLITVSTKIKAHVAFLAGVAAFVMTTTLFVTLGTVLIAFVPVYWVRLAGGVVMLGYGFWEARALVGLREVEREEAKVEKTGSPWKAFLALVAALALLDLAGDATEVLTIVFVARYADPLLVFLGACAGLICADAVETTLGSRLGKLLTPERLRYFSVVVFLALGASIIVLSP
jgi:Ca2+/H+ antiporter, TMEM165/GDT1 family